MNQSNTPKDNAPYTLRVEMAVDDTLAHEVKEAVRNKVNALTKADKQMNLSFVDAPKNDVIEIPAEHAEEVLEYVRKTIGSKIMHSRASIHLLSWNNTLILQDDSPDPGNVENMYGR